MFTDVYSRKRKLVAIVKIFTFMYNFILHFIFYIFDILCLLFYFSTQRFAQT